MNDTGCVDIAIDGRLSCRAETIYPGRPYVSRMVDKPQSGSILGIPYNFERPSLGRLVSSHWKPGDGMVVEKPFGIGYSLNMANWRSWVVVIVAAVLLWQERGGESDTDVDDADDEPVEVIVDD